MTVCVQPLLCNTNNSFVVSNVGHVILKLLSLGLTVTSAVELNIKWVEYKKSSTHKNES